MKRVLKLYRIEQKLALRSGDMLIFGVAMPVGIMILINMIAGSRKAAEGFTYLQSSFASLIAVGICAAAFMGILHKSYAMLLQYIEENGYEICGNIRESYIDGVWNKETEKEWLTEIQIPVK